MLLLQWLKGKKNAICFILAHIVILIIIAVIIIIYVLKMKCFYKGISINSLDVSGLSFQQARANIEELVNQWHENCTVILEYDNNAWSINCADIDLNMKYDDALERAYQIGRTGNYIDRLLEILNIRSKKVNIEPEITFNREKLKNILLKIKKDLDVKEENSQVFYDDKKITIDSHTVGLTMDIDKNIKLIENHILEKLNEKIILFVQENIPKITYDSIKEIKYIMSSFTTVFNPHDTNRNHNIKLACEKISGTIIMPGEIFSMNRALGARTEENGYKEAPVIVRNKFVQEVGGGICQVSTTLYVAAIKSGVEIIERRPHSMPLGYVKPGQDATIVEIITRSPGKGVNPSFRKMPLALHS
jgi:vancomycin resistance protein YoaR